MKFDENLAAVHAYLCADGYVIKNPKTQKHKYYRIGFRNTNLLLLKDFQKCFYNYFKIKPILKEGERCDKSSKEIHKKLIEEFNSFYSWEWRMPKLNKYLSRIWLRAFFDCEGWVFCKKHQNRHIGVDCVNKRGLNQIIKALNKLGIKTIKKYNKKRKVHRIFIYGKENLKKFAKLIGFLHLEKAERLNQTLKDFVVYEWKFPESEEDCKNFVLDLLRKKIRIKKPYYARVFSREGKNLKKLKDLLKKFYNINCNVLKGVNGIGTVYYELNICRKKEIMKIIDIGVIPNLFKDMKNN